MVQNHEQNKLDILVHISGPAQTSDDARFRSQAAAYAQQRWHRARDVPDISIVSLETERHQVLTQVNDSKSTPAHEFSDFRASLSTRLRCDNRAENHESTSIQDIASSDYNSSVSDEYDQSGLTDIGNISGIFNKGPIEHGSTSCPDGIHYNLFPYMHDASQSSSGGHSIVVADSKGSQGSRITSSSSILESIPLQVLVAPETARNVPGETLPKGDYGPSISASPVKNITKSFPTLPSTISDSQGLLAPETFIDREITSLAGRRLSSPCEEPSQTFQAGQEESYITFCRELSPPTLETGLQPLVKNLSHDILSNASFKGVSDNGSPVSAYEIHPPPPLTDTITLDPEKLISPSLAVLANTLDLSQRFKPSFCARDLRPLERGYWKVDMYTWPLHLQNRCWLFLEDLIGSGRIGWGTWCTRSNIPGEVIEHKLDETRNALQNIPHKDHALKVYCWGRTVGHIYLLILLASDRRIKNEKMQWFDGSETIVLEMH